MADSCSRLNGELFVPVLGLVDELSQATNDDEAIEHFACDKSRRWCQVGQALGQTDADHLPGQDLPDAVRTIAAIYEGTRTQCNTYPDVAIYIFRRLGTLKQAAQRGWTAAKQGGTIPEDPHPVSELPATMEVAGDGQIRLADWAVAAHGVLLDQINLGPRPAFGNKFPISDFDAIVVDGDTPSVCPKTDRPVDAIWLPEILEVFKRCGMVKSGQTIHWVGSQANLENVCTCFRKDLTSDVTTTGNAQGGDALAERLLAGPDDTELTDRELALLEANHAVNLTSTESQPRDAKSNHPIKPASDAPKKSKRSTERGEGRIKLISALTTHHKYAKGSCLNQESIGNNELARRAMVSVSTASAFFNKQFGGHTKYRGICGDITRLVGALKLLNQEFSPHHLFGAKPPDEHDWDDAHDRDDEE